jgi:predicted CoA-binding protein
MLDQSTIDRFLAGERIAVVGASDQRSNFGRTVYEALRDRGYDVVPVHPTERTVCGDAAYPDLASVPAPLDGAIVMVGPDRSPAIVREAALAHVPRVWLFQGLGGKGAASPDAVQLAMALGLEVIPGACPMMFLEPVGLAHRIHRAIRHANGSFRATAQQA